MLEQKKIKKIPIGSTIWPSQNQFWTILDQYKSDAPFPTIRAHTVDVLLLNNKIWHCTKLYSIQTGNSDDSNWFYW